MAQGDLFAEDSTLELPAVRYGPIRVAIGVVEAILRPASAVEAKRVGEIQVSARLKESLYQAANGERLVVTTRKNIARPSEADGVLLQSESGKLSWLHHSLIEELEGEAAKHGWPAVVHKRAEQWDGRFSFRAELPNKDGSVDEDMRGLRPPQLGALHAIGAHWSINTQPATIVMPTGTGKTETMLAAQAAYLRKPLLVVVPSDALRSQTSRKFLTFGLLRFLKVLPADVPNPIVGLVRKVPKTTEDLEIFDRCNVIIGTMDSLADSAAESVWPEIVKRVGALVIDEAHHIGARRWTSFREAFSGKPILQFTATPFRRDGQLVDGHVIYSYPLHRAQQDKYFKPITFEPVYETLAANADQAIAETAVARLREDLSQGLNHLMMARCSRIERARAVIDIYEALAPDLKPLLVHSDMGDT